MTDEEAALVLEDRPTESVRDLIARAEGWPALIGLAALASASEVPQEQISDALFRYFAEEVLRQEPPEMQEAHAPRLRACPRQSTLRSCGRFSSSTIPNRSSTAFAMTVFCVDRAPRASSSIPCCGSSSARSSSPRNPARPGPRRAGDEDLPHRRPPGTRRSSLRCPYPIAPPQRKPSAKPAPAY